MKQNYKNIMLILVLGFPFKEKTEGIQLIRLPNNKNLQLAYYKLPCQPTIKRSIRNT
jgi:hypothetical protein